MTQKRSKNATEQDYIAQQRAFETAQLGIPTNGYANVQEMQESLHSKEEELHKLQLAHEETVHMLEQERELNGKHVDTVRKLQNDMDEMMKRNSSLAERMENKNGEKRYLEEVLGHILIKTDKKFHLASLKGKDKVAKAYALPNNIVREYVNDDTIGFYKDQYKRRESNFRDEMKGMF